MNPIELIRDNIRRLLPYSTARDEFKGGNISAWLDANESPFNNGVNRYPDPHQKKLKHRISEIFGVSSESIFVGGAGSDEAIDIAYRVFCNPGIDNVIALTPSYGVYRVAADINNVEMREVELNPDFSLPTERILAACNANTKLIWICSPNNPTGNAFPLSEIQILTEKSDAMVIVDEAYADFSDKGSALAFVPEIKNLIVLRTFSKAWGMAGMRCGMAFGDTEIIKYFDRVKYPYNMSSFVQEELLRRLEQTPDRHINILRSERDRLADAISKAECITEIFPSDANFILVRTTDAKGLYDKLIDNGIIVRNRDSMPLCKGCLRITVGTPEENRRVIEIICGQSRTTETKEISGNRESEVVRKTSETDIDVSVNLDSTEESEIDTGLKFFDHMLWQIPHHAGIGLRIRCKGDLEVDEHHTMEDVAIAIGEALSKALGNKIGIDRYGFVLPMDECRAMVLIDLGGRIDFQWNVPFTREYIGDTPTEMFKHFFHSLCCAMKCNLHIEAKGENNHHLIEGVFKAFSRALRMAVRRDPGCRNLPSSKGML